jgi:hypothetical protein
MSRSVQLSKWTVLIGRTGFDTMYSIPDPTLSLRWMPPCDISSIFGRALQDGGGDYYSAGRCRMTASKPVLKALMVSALETIIYRAAFKLCFQFKLAPLLLGLRR